MNGATCDVVPAASYVCTCPADFTGANCQYSAYIAARLYYASVTMHVV